MVFVYRLSAGSQMVKHAPLSGLFSACMLPPCSAAICWATESPSPVPLGLVVKKWREDFRYDFRFSVPPRNRSPSGSKPGSPRWLSNASETAIVPFGAASAAL